ncbi:MAG: hypothetical protein NT085_05005 [candidate division SR1 bacterium]|nr:hypothetical protein [candidate division SR1 bacterium]
MENLNKDVIMFFAFWFDLLLSLLAYILFSWIGMGIIIGLYLIVLGIYLSRRKGYWVDTTDRFFEPSHSVAVRINKHGIFTVIKEKRFYVNPSDRIIYLFSEINQIELKTPEFITQDHVSFHADIITHVTLKKDETSILSAAYKQQYEERGFFDYICSNAAFKVNREIVEAKMREFIATKTFDEINPALYKEIIINMVNDLFMGDYTIIMKDIMVVKVQISK